MTIAVTGSSTIDDDTGLEQQHRRGRFLRGSDRGGRHGRVDRGVWEHGERIEGRRAPWIGHFDPAVPVATSMEVLGSGLIGLWAVYCLRNMAARLRQ